MNRTSQLPAGFRAALMGIAVAVLGLGIALIATIQILNAERAAHDRSREMLSAVRDSLGAAARPARAGGDAAAGRGPIEGISSDEIAVLRARGLADPVADLKDDLARHPELIPAAGTLGGRMGFYDRDRIWILNGRWVCADFEDGHVGGTALLEYRVENGRITWRPIASMGR